MYNKFYVLSSHERDSDLMLSLAAGLSLTMSINRE